MPAYLKSDRDRDILTIRLADMRGPEFSDSLARVKSVPGRRFDPESKLWEFPRDADTALRLMQMLAPVADAEVQAMVREHSAAVADALVTKLPEDAELLLPWSDRLRPYQRAAVAWFQKHPRAILADDMGIGKTVQAIATIQEYEFRYMRALQEGADPDELLRRFEEGEWSPGSLQGLPQRSDSTATDRGTSDASSGEIESMCGLRGATAAGSDGPGSREGSEAVRVCDSDRKSEASARGDREVRGPLSDLSPIAALPRLVVCPNSLKSTWQGELNKWLGDVPTVVIDGKNPTARKRQVDEIKSTPGCWAIVNWEKLRIMPELSKVKWLAVVADEAHRAKNRKAQQTKALWKLRAPLQIAASGTPIMSSPDELWAILHWMQPKVYSGYWPFYYAYTDSYQTRYGHVITGVKNADQLRFELADKLVRRTKRDVLKDLPPKTVQKVPVDLKPAQRRLYAEAEKALLLDIEETLVKGDEEKQNQLAAAIEAGDVERVIYLLPNGAARTTRLRQIASTPALLGGPDESAKLDAAEEIIRDNIGKPFVVFTWFADTARILSQRLAKGKPEIRAMTIAGDDDPEPVRAAFQEGDIDVVVATIAKGGVGLTLTRADTAIFVERDWTPAINAQAEDRLHRIGQANPVSIIVLEARDTIDVNKIAPANRLKELIASQVLGDQA